MIVDFCRPFSAAATATHGRETDGRTDIQTDGGTDIQHGLPMCGVGEEVSGRGKKQCFFHVHTTMLTNK